MDALRIFAEYGDADRYKAKNLNEIGDSITRIMAIDSSFQAKSMTSEKFRGLRTHYILRLGQK